MNSIQPLFVPTKNLQTVRLITNPSSYVQASPPIKAPPASPEGLAYRQIYHTIKAIQAHVRSPIMEHRLDADEQNIPSTIPDPFVRAFVENLFYFSSFPHDPNNYSPIEILNHLEDTRRDVTEPFELPPNVIVGGFTHPNAHVKYLPKSHKGKPFYDAQNTMASEQGMLFVRIKPQQLAKNKFGIPLLMGAPIYTIQGIIDRHEEFLMRYMPRTRYDDIKYRSPSPFLLI